MRARPSLKARGIQLLAQREHSRSELRAKLLRHALAEQAERLASQTSAAEADLAAVDDPDTADAAVDLTLDWLQTHHYLDEDRFVESRVHARAARYGNLRIRQELAQHGVALSADAADALKHSELERARAVWQRKFGEPPVDPAERARQMRFLAGRGFSAEIIRRVVAGATDD